MKKEIWRDIKGYEGYYQVSNKGGIKAVDRTITRSDGVKRFYPESLKSPHVNNRGYVIVGLSIDNIKVNKKVHRLVAKAFIPNIENKPQINHRDANKENNNVDNLEWCTNYENCKHAHENGLRKIEVLKGEDSNLTTTKKKTVIAMRKLYKQGGYSYQDMAKKFNVGDSCAYHILTRRSWKHI